jgi:hypothetical protein
MVDLVGLATTSRMVRAGVSVDVERETGPRTRDTQLGKPSRLSTLARC